MSISSMPLLAMASTRERALRQTLGVPRPAYSPVVVPSGARPMAWPSTGTLSVPVRVP